MSQTVELPEPEDRDSVQETVYVICVICHVDIDTSKGYYNSGYGPRCQDCGEPEKSGFFL